MKNELVAILRCLARIGSSLSGRLRWRLILAIVLMTLGAIMTNIPALALGWLMDRCMNAPGIHMAVVWPGLVAIMAAILLREAFLVGRRYLVEDACTRIERQVRIGSIDHLLGLDLNFFSHHQVGALHGRLNRCIDGVVRLLKLGFMDFLPAGCVAGCALIIALTRSPWLGFLMMLVIPVGILIVLRQIHSQKGIRVDLLRGKEEIDGAVVELLGGLETIRAMNTHRVEMNRVANVAERLRVKEICHHFWMAIFDAAKSTNEGIFHILVLSAAIWLASRGEITSGDILTFSMMFLGVLTPLREVHRILDEAHEATLCVLDLFTLMDTPLDRALADQNWNLDSSSKAQLDTVLLSIHGLSYTYPGAEGPALSRIDLDIRAGQFIGICGAAGCGKSTLLKILMRLHHVEDNRIELMGQELNNYSREVLAQHIFYVSQQPFLFFGSFHENIAYGLIDVPVAEIERAARQAQIHEEIVRMGGYDASIGERGCKLSGGQRQRIALARAFLRNPAILILDEATSALDNINEHKVLLAIQEKMREGTIIAIAHRLSALRNTDRILVFDNGRIIEEGDFASLASGKGAFARLLGASDGVRSRSTHTVAA